MRCALVSPRLARSEPTVHDEAVEPARDTRELDDVPAAVICARCGASDCAGCEQDLLSGVVQVIPWERETGGMFTRMWSTARLATFEPETFLGKLPDGPIHLAIRFAVLSETLAVGALSLCGVALLAVAYPTGAKALFLDATYRRLGLGAFPAVVALLVFLHGAYGVCLDVAARASGAEGNSSRGVRFGLYTAGWDIVHGPIGAIVLAIREGAKGALRAATIGVGLPTRASVAFLESSYGLDSSQLTKARRLATLFLSALLLTLSVLLCVGLVWLAFS